MANRQFTRREVFIIVCLFAIALRLGYGIARFGGLLTLHGTEFISLWDYDALEHLLIAKSINLGQGYTVFSDPSLVEKHIRFAGSFASYKAPLYQYFLAMLFGIGGFSFVLFFPIQAIFGGILSGLVALITIDVFKNRFAGLIAGAAVGAHPVLINTASQPYNENLFFMFFALTLWIFLQWFRSGLFKLAVMSGICAGITALIRESMMAPLIVMVAFSAISFFRERDWAGVTGSVVVIATAVLTISPWTYYTYQQLGVVVPISSITGSVLASGNNECRAAESAFVPFYGDLPCNAEDSKRRDLLAQMPNEPAAVRFDQANRTLGIQFVLDHPADYVKLCLRRLWTALLPFHPIQGLGLIQKSLMAAYFASVLVVGVVAAFREACSRPDRDVALLISVMLATLAPMILIFVSHDLRFRIGFDIILAIFAGHRWSRYLGSQTWSASQK